MSKQSRRNFLKLAGIAAASAVTGTAMASENPFSLKPVEGAAQQVAMEGNCGAGMKKKGATMAEGQCGAGMKKKKGATMAEGQCGAGMKKKAPAMAEGQCGAGMKKKKAPAMAEGQCGAGMKSGM